MSDTNKIRVISGAVLTVVVAVAGYIGGYVLLVGCFALSVIGLKEYNNCLSINDSGMVKASYLLAAVYYLIIFLSGKKALYTGAVIAFILYMLMHIKKYPANTFGDTVKGFAGFVWIPYLMSFIYLSRVSKGGFALYALLFISSWLGDTFAYSVGRRFGKHKMTPVLSPKKSWEGFIAEVIGVTAIGLIYGILAKNYFTAYKFPVIVCAAASFFGSLLSVAGDLTASAVKRENGIKDYGTLIPGHGGVMDRFDSILFAAPFVFIVFELMVK